MTEQTQTKVVELESAIQSTKAKTVSVGKEISSLRNEIARLSIEHKEKNQEEISQLNHKVFKLETESKNLPSELKLLEENLATEKQNDAAKQREELLKQQNKVAREVEELSERFINTLTTANEINSQLLAARTAEASLAQKSGQQVLESYCQGSEQSLSMLLELMEYQMEGHQTMPAGGMIGSNAPIRL